MRQRRFACHLDAPDPLIVPVTQMTRPGTGLMLRVSQNRYRDPVTGPVAARDLLTRGSSPLKPGEVADEEGKWQPDYGRLSDGL